MISAACGHENREGAKFCGECGAPLAMACPTCGSSIDSKQKFCTECATPLRQSPALSPEAVCVSGERKQITVLFADVAGSMDLQERLDAEVWAQVMGRFVSILAEGVRRFGGTVDKFTGDGIMALFGAPVAQEDHARRACHAAWHLTKAIGEYSEDVREQLGVELHVRLGLNSGEVVVGRVGDDVTVDPTALGHTVGLAQRMEGMAERGTTYVTEHTARLAEGSFRLDDLGRKAVKGSSAELRVFRLGGPVSSPVRRTAGVLSSTVGRERELAVLEDALAMASQGQVQIVGVVGEAGVGKSRVCDELAATAARRGITVRRTTGLSHGRDIPLVPILALLRDHFAITESDDAATARKKIAGRVLTLDPGGGDGLPLLFDFLEVPDPGRPVPQLAPELRLQKIFETLQRLIQRRSGQEVLVVLVEDLHWFDAQSLKFLERLIECYSGSRTLLLTNFRPEFSAGWMRHPSYRPLPLRPLQPEAVSELVRERLGSDLSLSPLVPFLFERTNGNPFFLEEVLRVLVDDGTLVGEPGCYRLARPMLELKVPARVQSVLAARIDRLDKPDKELLQAAAVIGGTFPETVLAKAAGLVGSALSEAVDVLCGAELLQPAHGAAVPEYRFWHPLTQDVAYGSLLRDRRRELHAAVADAWVAVDPSRHDERAALIASHYAGAGQRLEAARWEYRAATWGQRRDLDDSARRWRTVLSLLEGDEQTEETVDLGVRARLQLLRSRGRTSTPLDDAEVLYSQARVMAEGLTDPSLLVMVLYGRGVQLAVRGDVRVGQETWLEAARLATALSDPGLRAVAFLAPVIGSAYAGPLGQGLHYADQAEQATGGDPALGAEIMGYSPLVRTVHFRAEVLAVAGQLARARTEARRALQLARERSETFTLAWTISLLIRLADLDGSQSADGALIGEAARLAGDPGDLVVRTLALQTLGQAALMTGEVATAKQALQRALAEVTEHGAGLNQVAILTALARGHLADDPDAAQSAANEAVAVAERQGARVVKCLALLTRAHVSRVTGSSGQARPDLHTALALVKETGALTYEPFIHEELGRLDDDSGELGRALRLYRQIGATGHARRLKAGLSMRTSP